MRVLLTGAGGYLGGAVLPALEAAGHDVRVLPRPAADIVADRGLAEACAGCEAVVHLVGALRGRPADLEALHVRGTQHLVRAAVRASVRRFVHVSAVGAAADGRTAYQRTKWAGEQAVAASGLPFVIVRPTVIFGPGGPGPNLVRQLGGILAAAPVMPVFGDGRFLLQPVSSANVASGLVGALTSAPGRSYEVGGPERLTYLEVLRRIASRLGRPFRPVFLPAGLVSALVRLPGFPVGPEEWIMLRAGNVCDAQHFFADFRLTPEAFAGA